jgi:transcriptional regulator with XRE-family HTH domain
MSRSLCINGCDQPVSGRGLCNACYKKRRYRDVGYGRWETTVVPAAETAAHLEALRAAGISYERTAELTGLYATTVRGVAQRFRRNPNAQVSRMVADSIQRLQLSKPLDYVEDGAQVPLFGVTRRLQALARLGYTSDDLGARLNMTPPHLRRLARGGLHMTVRADTFKKVAALYDQLWDRPGPSRTTADRSAAKGWALPLCWNDDTIDDPSAKPFPGGRRTASFTERYLELRHHVGIRDTELIAQAMGITVKSLERQLQRHREALAS